MSIVIKQIDNHPFNNNPLEQYFEFKNRDFSGISDSTIPHESEFGKVIFSRCDTIIVISKLEEDTFIDNGNWVELEETKNEFNKRDKLVNDVFYEYDIRYRTRVNLIPLCVDGSPFIIYYASFFNRETLDQFIKYKVNIHSSVWFYTRTEYSLDYLKLQYLKKELKFNK